MKIVGHTEVCGYQFPIHKDNDEEFIFVNDHKYYKVPLTKNVWCRDKITECNGCDNSILRDKDILFGKTKISNSIVLWDINENEIINKIIFQNREAYDKFYFQDSIILSINVGNYTSTYNNKAAKVINFESAFNWLSNFKTEPLVATQEFESDRIYRVASTSNFEVYSCHAPSKIMASNNEKKYINESDKFIDKLEEIMNLNENIIFIGDFNRNHIIHNYLIDNGFKQYGSTKAETAYIRGCSNFNFSYEYLSLPHIIEDCHMCLILNYNKEEHTVHRCKKSCDTCKHDLYDDCPEDVNGSRPFASNCEYYEDSEEFEGTSELDKLIK